MIESALERLPRRLHVPRLVPEADLAHRPGEGDAWLATGSEPCFGMSFETGRAPTGWIYVETALQRSVGSRTAWLHVERADGSRSKIAMTSNLRGSVRELVALPDDTVQLSWQPTGSPGYVRQLPLLVYELGEFERCVRMLDRVLLGRRRGDAGPSDWRILIDADRLAQAYRSATDARSRLATDDYSAFIQQERRGRAWERCEDLWRRAAPAVRTPFFVVHAVGGLGVEDAADWQATWASVRAQTYPNVGREEELAAAPPATDNQALWHLRVRSGDILAPDALQLLAATILAQPQARVVYSDHDFLGGADGRRTRAIFKPDWNVDLFLTHDYLANLCALRGPDGALGDRWGAEHVADAAWQRRILEAGTQPTGVVHLPLVLCHRRCPDMHVHPTGGDAGAGPLLAPHPTVRDVEFAAGPWPGVFRAIWPLPSRPVRVSVIVPTRDRLEILKPCVESVLNKTCGVDFELIVVDNGSSEPRTLQYLQEIATHPQVRVVACAGRFNYSRINNFAVDGCTGDFLVFLNNDTEVVAPDWMSHLLRHACREDVGAVGARLLYTDSTVQHAGVILGVGGVAGHAHRFFPGDGPGYAGRIQLAHGMMAVTGACLMVKRERFLAVGGFNEADLKISLNDVDLCLKLTARGWRSVYEPAALLYHHESISRGADDTPEKRQVFEQERAYMKAQWQWLLGADPAYNPNLTLDTEDFALAMR